MNNQEENGKKPKILVFASDDGLNVESRFQSLVESTRTTPAILNAEIVGLISTRPVGGLLKLALNMGIESKCCDTPFPCNGIYQCLMEEYGADFILLLGWFRPVLGIDPAKVIVAYFDPLSAYGQYRGGGYIYEGVYNAFVNEKISQSIISVNFLGGKGKLGPAIHQVPVPIRDNDVSELIARRASERMNNVLPMVLNKVVHGYIFLHDGNVQRADNNPKNEWYM